MGLVAWNKCLIDWLIDLHWSTLANIFFMYRDCDHAFKHTSWQNVDQGAIQLSRRRSSSNNAVSGLWIHTWQLILTGISTMQLRQLNYITDKQMVSDTDSTVVPNV